MSERSSTAGAAAAGGGMAGIAAMMPRPNVHPFIRESPAGARDARVAEEFRSPPEPSSIICRARASGRDRK